LGRVGAADEPKGLTISVSRAALDELSVWWVNQSGAAQAALNRAPPPETKTQRAVARIPAAIAVPTEEERELVFRMAEDFIGGKDPDELIAECSMVLVPNAFTVALQQWELGTAFEEAERLVAMKG